MVSRCRAWERGAKARLVSAAAARYGASEVLLSVIMVFCRLPYAPSCKEEGRKGGAHTRETWRNATRTQAYKGRNLIPFFHPLLSLSLDAVCSPSLVYSFALSSPDSSVAVFLSLLTRPRDNDPELSKHHRWTLIEIESTRATRHDAMQASAARAN